MKILETKSVRTQTTKRIEVTEEQLCSLIKVATGNTIPDTAEIFVQVPGGGDWSNTPLDISDSPIIITWTEVTEE